MGNDSTKAVLGWVVGIASIAFVLLLMVIIFGNLSGNTGIPDGTGTIYVTNESADTSGVSIVYLNTTGYTLSGYNSSWSSITLTSIWNVSASGNYNITIGTGNATITSGVLTNSTAINGTGNVSVSYNYVYTFTSLAEQNAENIIGNYTSGATNNASQFPTVGTILGVALLILILLALLVFVITKMGGVSRGSGTGMGTSKSGGGFNENFA